ncbi:MAG TPA: glyoxylate/hydroxypyruvate reductase A [Xanthobacteraceae bacterium]|nr:glyoxylate/hydroxypyruvate reductase A [Xanthobacteraceae bacterium]
MSKGTLVLSIQGGADNWSPQRWVERFNNVGNGRKIVLLPDRISDPDDVHYAAVWKPPAGVLAAFRNLRVIFNLGAGVDALMADPTLPMVPVVRVAVDDLTGRMTEYVVLHVLMHHRQQLDLRDNQSRRLWQPKAQWAAGAVTVGVMGLGTLGRDAAEVLRRIGFRVIGWSNSDKRIDGVECFCGRDGLAPFLARTHILVCLLPLTAQTRHILDRKLFEKLARNSPLGAPVLINAGRGGLQVESDIVSCLDDGTLLAATLDVFETEPLPATSPLWTHPRVVITPHNAADTDPDAISAYVAEQIARFEAGEPLRNVVDIARGY